MSEFAPRVRWDRIGRLALLFVGLLLIYLYINPLRTYVSTWQEAQHEARRGRRSCSASTPSSSSARAGAAQPGQHRGRGAPPGHGQGRRARVRRPRARPRASARAAARRVPCRGVATSFETALGQWREGERRMAGAPPEQRRALELVVSRIEAELRRRLGGTFTTDELAELYERGHGLVHRPRRRRSRPTRRGRGTRARSPTRRSCATCATPATSRAGGAPSRSALRPAPRRVDPPAAVRRNPRMRPAGSKPRRP